MGLPTVSSPFNYLIQQIQTDLLRAVGLCQAIRKNRNIGTSHKELDNLEECLSEGPSFVRRQAKKAKELPGADIDDGDDIARSELSSYTREVESINERLENISHPPTHHPQHHHHHHHHHNSFFFPCYDYAQHKEKESPHFHELCLKWENVRDGIEQTFAQLAYRLEVKEEEKKKNKKQEDEKKEKDAKKEKEEKEKKAKEETERKEREDELEKKLVKKEQKEQERLQHEEDIQEQRDKEVQKLVKKTLEEDPIDDLDRLATVIGHIQKSIPPTTDYKTVIVPVHGDSRHPENRSATVIENIIQNRNPPSISVSESSSQALPLALPSGLQQTSNQSLQHLAWNGTNLVLVPDSMLRSLIQH